MTRKKYTLFVDTDLMAKVDQLVREEAARKGERFTRTGFIDRALRDAVAGIKDHRSQDQG